MVILVMWLFPLPCFPDSVLLEGRDLASLAQSLFQGHTTGASKYLLTTK